jgi:hypothetical protein
MPQPRELLFAQSTLAFTRYFGAYFSLERSGARSFLKRLSPEFMRAS